MPWEIVVAGGGFGGFHTARTLEKTLPSHSSRIRLVNDVNFMLYTPLLPGATGGTLSANHIVVPLRQSLTTTDLQLGRVEGADPKRNVLHVMSQKGRIEELYYDQLIVAVGSISRALPVPGLVEHGCGFKSLPDGFTLRNRLIEMLEVAETLEDPKERAAYLTFVFVGAGYAGLEGLAELQDFASYIVDLYPRCRLQGTRWIMVEAMDRVMPEIPPDLAAFAVRELKKRGIEVRTNTIVKEISENSVLLSDGTEVPTGNVVWTAGVEPHPVVKNLGLPLERGRIKVDRFMQVKDHDNVWAIGDAAAVPDPARKGQPCPPTAQHAIRQGRRVARNVAAALGSGRKRPFTYKTLGVFVDMGRHQAVASTLGIKWRGFPAWFLARTYHLSQMPGTKRKLRLMSEWTVDLILGRVPADLGVMARRQPLGAPPESKSDGASGPQLEEGEQPAAGKQEVPERGVSTS